MDKNVEIFVVYIAALLALVMQIYPLSQAQLELLLAGKAFIEALLKYLDYTDTFSFDLIIQLSKNTDMNEYTIELVEDKQPPYGPIHNLK